MGIANDLFNEVVSLLLFLTAFLFGCGGLFGE
nr:MAG TPA: hypothetical protein [Caudoviricetes sp.]